MKKVMYYVHNLNYGGIETLVLDWAKRLNKDEFQPVICVNQGTDKSELDWEKDGIRKIFLNVLPYKKNPGDKLPSLSRLIGNISKLYKVIAKEKPDVFHCHDFWTAFFAFPCVVLNGVKKFIIHRHLTLQGEAVNMAKSSEEADSFKVVERKFIPSLFLRFLSFFAYKVLAVSTETAEDAVRNGVLQGKVRLLLNGVDLEKIDNDRKIVDVQAKKIESGVLNNFPIIGAVGNLKPQKGYKYLIESFPKIKNRFPDAKIIIVGGWGTEILQGVKDELDNLCKKLGITDSVIFAGYQKSSEFIPIFDICVMSSLHEGLSMALLEFMANEKPVVTTKVEGASDVIDSGKNGIIVEQKSPDAIADAIINIIEDEKLRASMCVEARKTVEEKFRVENMILTLEEIYR